MRTSRSVASNCVPSEGSALPKQSTVRDIQSALEWLAKRPAFLFLFLLLLSTFSNPYAGITHDASLYSLQVLNRSTGGWFSDDLFLKYGSQDRFSAFSLVAAPLVKTLGVQPVFFLLYYTANTLLLWAFYRLSVDFLGRSALAALSAFLLAAVPLSFGGLYVFRVNEAFFTPRLLAAALVAIGLSEILRRRSLRAFSAIAAAALFHPLMASPALLVWLAGFLSRTPYLRGAIFIALGTSVSMLLANFALPHAYSMDASWRESILAAAPYNFPAEWRPLDWLHTAVAWTIVAAGAYLHRRERPDISHFLTTVATISAAGVCLTAIAPSLDNPLLFQAQPYRAIWLTSVLQVPVALAVAARAAGSFRTGSSLALFAFLWFLGESEYLAPELIVATAVFCVLFVLNGLFPLGLRTATAMGTSVLFSIVFFRIGLLNLLMGREQPWVTQLDAIAYTRTIFVGFGPLSWCMGAIVFAVWSRQQRRLTSPVLAMLLVLLVSVPIGLTAVPLSTAYHQTYGSSHANVRFVRQYLSKIKHPEHAPPTIYADWGSAHQIWLDLGANSYFHLTQSVGLMFNPRTADEVRRRANMVAPFELRRWRRPTEAISYNTREMIDRLFSSRAGSGDPSPVDLLRLCDDPLLDVAVLKDSVSGVPGTGNGELNIYDCGVLRRELHRTDGHS